MLTDSKPVFIFYALASAFFAGLTAILGKIGVEKIPSNLATLIRTVVIFFFLAGLISVRREWLNPMRLSNKGLLFLVLSGLATGLSWICYYRALQLGPASLVAPIDKLSVVVALVLAAIFLSERLSLWQYTGAALVVIGVILLIEK